MESQKRKGNVAESKDNPKKLGVTFIILVTITLAFALTSCLHDDDTNNNNDSDNNENTLGAITGEPILAPKSLAQQLLSIEDELRPVFEEIWFSRLDDFVNQYRNGDGDPDPLEAYFGVMFASTLEDNAYPFCIAAIRAMQIEPDNPFVLNSVAVCLLRINKLQLVARVLDVAIDTEPDLYLTWENAAGFFHASGDVDNAIIAMENASIVESNSAFTLWSAAEYAAWNGRTVAANNFRSSLPSNYPFQNSDGTTGGNALATQCFFCGCNDTYYDDSGACVSSCRANLGCFNQVCVPSNDNCCGDVSPFSLKAKICFPPTGAQACLGANTKGDMEISIQGNLAELTKVGIKGTLSFADDGLKTGISVYSNVAGVGASLDLVTGKVGSSFSNGSFKVTDPIGGKELGVFGLSIGLPTVEQWTIILFCAFN